MTDKLAPSLPPQPEHWSVTVTRNGEPLVTIETDCLSGKPEFSEEDEETIRDAARHLLSFIGEKHDAELF